MLPDYYKTLGVRPSCDPERIDEAFFRKVQKCHPDQKECKTDEFLALNIAFLILSDSEARSRYDRQYNAVYGLWSKRRGGGEAPFDPLLQQWVNNAIDQAHEFAAMSAMEYKKLLRGMNASVASKTLQRFLQLVAIFIGIAGVLGLYTTLQGDGGLSLTVISVLFILLSSGGGYFVVKS